MLHLWRSRNALALKALTLAIQPHLQVSARCVHIRGHGGLQGAVREIRRRLSDYTFVTRTDVAGYYEHINQSLLLNQLRRELGDGPLLDLLRQAIERTAERGGLYWDIRQGISRGCPLSPPLGRALPVRTR